jgi:hypothetical protein
LEIIGDRLHLLVNPILDDLDGLHNLQKIGELYVSNCDAITNIDQFENITLINGGVRFSSNDNLLNLSGLRNVGHFGEFLVVSNDKLQALGLTSLTTVEGGFGIEGNSMLDDISSLNNLTSIGGSLIINGSNSLTSLEGFENLTSIGNALIIRRTTSLVNLNGLDNLAEIRGSGIAIENNEVLINLDGLTGNISMGSNNDTTPNSRTGLSIANNYLLEEIDALENLSFINVPTLFIDNNPELLNLNGLTSVESCNDLHIHNNSSLEDLDGLINLTRVECDNSPVSGDLVIDGNISLNDFCGLTTLLENDGVCNIFTIRDNQFNPAEQDLLNGNCEN